jgi:hypothetical protein
MSTTTSITALAPSRHLERFKRLATVPGVKLAGSLLIIEKMPEPEIKSAGGLILVSTEEQSNGAFQRQKAHVATILMVGEDAADSGLAPGNIVLIAEFGIRSYTTFPGITHYVDGELQLSSVEAVHLSFKDASAFEAATKALADGSQAA